MIQNFEETNDGPESCPNEANIEDPHIQEVKTNNKSCLKISVIILSVLLLCALAGISFLAFREKNRLQDNNESTNHDKVDWRQKYEELREASDSDAVEWRNKNTE